MVRILQLSDLHFALSAQVNNMETVLKLGAEEAVRGLGRHEKLLIITGDFRNFNDSDYHRAETFLDELFTAMDIDPAEGVFVIPGNHDVGNDALLEEQMKAQPYWKRLQKSALADLKKEQPEDWEDSLNLRLECYKPYCDFVRRLGIYPAGDDLLPAQVHVRCWNETLNILHLNTTLIYEPEVYGNQKLDIRTATGKAIWKDVDPDLPALVLGHNSFYDLCEAQRHQLRTPFFTRNVSAYLCGDTHRKEYNPEHQTIPLEANRRDGIRIPNVVCPKGVSDENDDYSDFGFYCHDWDTETDTVTFQFWRWRPGYGPKTQPDGNVDDYRMRWGARKRPGRIDGEPLRQPGAHGFETLSSDRQADERQADKLLGYWADAFQTRTEPDRAVEASSALIQYMDSLGPELSTVMAVCHERASSDPNLSEWTLFRTASNEAQKPLAYAEALLRDVECRVKGGLSASVSFTMQRLVQAKEIIAVHREKFSADPKAQEETLRLLEACENLCIAFLCQQAEAKPFLPAEELRLQFILPCLDALERLKTLGRPRMGKWDQVHKTFFDVRSAVLQRVVGLEEDAADYDELFCRLKQLSEYPLPSEHRPVLSRIDASRGRNRTEFLFPVFSGSFDSVLGKDSSRMRQMEFALFQQVANGKTVVLQGPQIADNRNMLELLHTDGFRRLCEDGYVVFSPFGKIDTPIEYLLSRLSAPDFVFSSFEGYEQHPEWKLIVRNALAGVMSYRDIRKKFPCQSEMEMLYDSYRMMREVFPAWNAVYYHQNPARRKGTTPISHTYPELSQKGLVGFIEDFIDELKTDDKRHPVPGREQMLSYFDVLLAEARSEKSIQERPLDRSPYYHFIDNKIKQETGNADTVKMLEHFLCVVDRSYTLCNGKLSCDDVRVQTDDDMLRLHSENDAPQNDFLVDFHIQLYQVATSSPARRLLRWRDLIKDADNAREQLIAQHRGELRDSDYCDRKEKDGILVRPMYPEGSPNQACEVIGMSCETSAGECFDITTDSSRDAVRLPNEQAVIDEPAPKSE